MAMVRGRRNPRHLGLPARMRKARKQSGLTRMALAQKAGVGTPTALYAETGKQTPTVGTIVRLASALSVSAAWLGYGLGNPDADKPEATTEGMGGRLQTVRVEQGLTKAALARLVSLSPGTVADIENGAQTGIDVLEALAKELAISPAWLAFDQGPRELLKRRHAAKSQEPAHP